MVLILIRERGYGHFMVRTAWWGSRSRLGRDGPLINGSSGVWCVYGVRVLMIFTPRMGREGV